MQSLPAGQLGEERDVIADKDVLKTSTKRTDGADELKGVMWRIFQMSSEESGQILGKAVGGDPVSIQDKPKGSPFLEDIGEPVQSGKPIMCINYRKYILCGFIFII